MIYTLYSTEHQTGCSMALANLAELFYQRGLRVLIVDWDIQSPGLETFFPIEEDKVREQPGLIDMLLDYKSNISQPLLKDDEHERQILPLDGISSYLLDIYPDRDKGGNIFLLPARKRIEKDWDNDNTLRKSFDFHEFIQNWEGEVFFDWLRQQFLQVADVVLIDNPAGNTSVLFSCTSYLADAAILFCTVHHGSLSGTTMVANGLLAEELSKKRGRPLDLLIIPSRIDSSFEIQGILDFRSKYLAQFMHLMPRLEHEIGKDLFDFLRIPYIPYFSLPGKLAIRERGQGDYVGLEMAEPFDNIASAMALLTKGKGNTDTSKEPWDETVSLERLHKLRERITETATIFISYASEDRDKARSIYDRLRIAGFKPWLDKEDLLAGQDWRAVIKASIEKSDFVIVCLSKQSIYKRGFVQKEIVWSLDVVQLMPENTIYLLPVRLEDCEVPERLSGRQWVDLFEAHGFENLERAIRSELRSRRQRLLNMGSSI